MRTRFTAVLLALLLLLGACSPVESQPPPTTAAPPATTAAPVTTAPPETTAPASEAPVTEPPPPEILPQWDTWLVRNEDFVGWITVPGTIIDYPVVYCEDNAFYLTHDFDTYSDPDGTIFLSMEADLLEHNQSWSLFGHHRKNGRMFSDLHKYKKLAFLQDSPVFTFDTLYQEARYVIFSVFYMAGNQDDAYFYYYPRSDFPSDAQFEHHIDQLQSRSIFDIPVEVLTTDQIVILTCCSYETEDLRIGIAARRLREGEDTAELDTSVYAVAENPFYPKKWYDKYGGQPPADVLERLYPAK